MLRFFPYRSLMRHTWFLWLVLSSGFVRPPVQAAQIFFEVPNGLLSTNGNDASRLPFGYLGPVRYQQVYDASQFSRVPPKGAFITRIFFRPACSSTRSWVLTNLQVNV